MKLNSPYVPAQENPEELGIEPKRFLHSRYIDFHTEEENEKLREITEQIFKVKDQVEEALIIQVLTQLLKRKPGVEDFKMVTKVFGPPEINTHAFVETLQKYSLMYSRVTLGVVVLERRPDHKCRFMFYPEKDFK